MAIVHNTFIITNSIVQQKIKPPTKKSTASHHISISFKCCEKRNCNNNNSNNNNSNNNNNNYNKTLQNLHGEDDDDDKDKDEDEDGGEDDDGDDEDDAGGDDDDSEDETKVKMERIVTWLGQISCHDLTERISTPVIEDIMPQKFDTSIHVKYVEKQFDGSSDSCNILRY
ncbi:hypothetical protein HELRODRAFT_181558 [Helobdella robusta]|uniref:Uncharacterized protein n=1 Tax=Helobdella robusta TaxID=6412 RepID=T1FH40_HELRO|nr:hypothetical protein HELRODRAFT_181558 [Helobdella robusta]ESN92359.1 hypothetical protein HELRODRAFT_181558 [Helobdella robusta]